MMFSRSNVTARRAFSTVHAAAQKGFSAEGANAYEKGRPTYNSASLAQICEIIRKSNSQKDISILELGSGTGKFTESLVPFVIDDKSFKISKYIATEPSEGFRNALSAKNIPSVTAVDGTGELIPAETHSIDAVVIAQAFHWMDNLTTLNEIHRVLKPGGVLLVI